MPLSLPLRVLVSLPSLWYCATAQTDYFIVPGPTSTSQDYSDVNVYPVGSTMQMSWTTDWTAYNITLWQQNLVTNDAAFEGPAVYSTDGSPYAPKVFQWQVQRYGFIPTMDVFYLLARSANGTENFSSTYFNITGTSASAITSSSTSPIPSASSSPTSASAPSSTATSLPSGSVLSASAPSVSPIESTPSAPANTNSLKIGLGVGLGVGLPLFLAFGVAMGWWFSRRSRGYKHPATAEVSGQGLERKELPGFAPYKQPSELGSYRRNHELSA